MNRILTLRKAAGMSQNDLAKVLFVNQTAVSQWERGATAPGYDFLQKMADYFNVSTDYLLGRDSHMLTDDKKTASDKIIFDDYDFALYRVVRELNNEDKDALIKSAQNMNELRLFREAIFKRDNYICCQCGKSDTDGDDLVIDHIIPISKGGPSTIDNFQTLCHKCNMKKGNSLPGERC